MLRIIIRPAITLSIMSLAFYIAISYYPAFKNISERISAYQTFLGFIAVLIGYVGIYEFVKKLRQKFDMKFQVGGFNLLNIESDKFPLSLEIPFFVANTGDFSIKKDEVYYNIRFPNSFELKVVSGPKDEQGNMMVPNIHDRVDYDKNVKVITGNIPVNIHPGRRNRIFTIRVVIPSPNDYALRYYFSTEQGYIPNSISVDDCAEPVSGLGKMGLCVKHT